MIVVVLSACPVGLRGDLTRWLLEISAGVFVGKVSARVREHLWNRITVTCSDGRALMVYSADNEYRLDFKVHNYPWEPVDFEGVKLMVRPSTPKEKLGLRKGWSKASRYRRASQRRHR